MWDGAGTGSQTQQLTGFGAACVAVEGLEANLRGKCWVCSAANTPTVRDFPLSPLVKLRH